MIAQHINVTIEPIDATHVPFLEKVVGLYNGSYDLFGYTVESTKGRLEDFEFSEALYESTTKFAVRRSDSRIKSVFDFFTVYGVDVYSLLFAAFVVFTMFGILVRLAEFRLFLRKQIGIGEFLWQMLRLQLIQSENLAYKLKAGNISLITFAFFQCVLVISLYQSWVLTSLVRSRSILPFKIQDLVTVIKNKQFYFVAAREKEWYYEMINKTFESPFYELRAAMIENPVRVVHRNSLVLKELNGGRAIAVIQDDTAISYSVTKECDLVFLEVGGYVWN
ncbi:hypothetical protein M3Y95_01092900 [Aphelenchoides besseyi]|nr:hypothetical protein M3Y95_01092900 [Aphelenchoides besseyi]